MDADTRTLARKRRDERLGWVIAFTVSAAMWAFVIAAAVWALS